VAPPSKPRPIQLTATRKRIRYLWSLISTILVLVVLYVCAGLPYYAAIGHTIAHPASGFHHARAFTIHVVPRPHFEILIVGIAAGAAIVYSSRTWRTARYAVTFIHELGHAVSVGMVGGVPMALVIEPNSAGRTTHLLPEGTARRVVTAAAGYPAPAIAALFLAQLLVFGDPAASAVVAAALGGAVLVLWARNVRAAIGSILLAAVGLLAFCAPWVLFISMGLFIGVLAIGGFRSSYDAATLSTIDTTPNDSLSIHEAIGLPPRMVGITLCIATGALAAGTLAVLVGAV